MNKTSYNQLRKIAFNLSNPYSYHIHETFKETPTTTQATGSQPKSYNTVQPNYSANMDWVHKLPGVQANIPNFGLSNANKKIEENPYVKWINSLLHVGEERPVNQPIEQLTNNRPPTHQEIAQKDKANRNSTSFNDRLKNAVTAYGDFLIGADNNPTNVVYSKAPTQTERQKFEADYMSRLQGRNINELSPDQHQRLENWQKTQQK